MRTSPGTTGVVAFGASNIGLPFPNIVLGDVEQGSVAERVVVGFK